jgi:hypothetical protein
VHTEAKRFVSWAGQLNGRPKRACCPADRAAVTPAVIPAAVGADVPVEGSEAIRATAG